MEGEGRTRPTRASSRLVCELRHSRIIATTRALFNPLAPLASRRDCAPSPLSFSSSSSYSGLPSPPSTTTTISGTTIYLSLLPLPLSTPSRHPDFQLPSGRLSQLSLYHLKPLHPRPLRSLHIYPSHCLSSRSPSTFYLCFLHSSP